MFNKNVFTQKDPIADLVKPMLEAQTQQKLDELKGNQKVLDKNKNNKLDAQDFKILRGEKKTVKEEEQVEEGWDDMLKAAKERSGPQPSGGSGKKLGTRYGGSKQKDKPEQDDDKKKVKEEVDLAEATMTHITLGKKVKNSDGGHDQDVHYKGKKIGSISSYKHRTGLRYGSEHHASGEAEAGSRSPEEAVSFVRSAHAQHMKSQNEEVEQVVEASYSAKAAAAGKDIGKPGKMFKKIAKGAAARYGSAERGKKVAGAVLAKLRKEETDFEPLLIDQIVEDTMSAIEQLDELKKTTVKSYIKKKMDQVYKTGAPPSMSHVKKTMTNLQRAHDRNTGVKPTSEGAVMEAKKEEKKDDTPFEGPYSKKPSAKAGKYGSGYSTARHLARQGAKKAANEEVEQIDELKKSTLASYAKKATDDVSYHSFSAGTRSEKDPERLKDDQKAMKRQAGVSKAVDRLAKEEVQIDERSLSSGETAEKERIVKGMKKNLSGFKARYGDKAKSVMYATATKAAKKD